MRLAEEICMLDQMSGGRLQVGMGRGAVALEQELYDVDPATTAKRYEEARDIVIAALTSPKVDFQGEHFRVRDFPMILQCLQKPRPPLWYGLGNPDAAVWAASVAANVISLRPAHLARAALERYRQEWQALGRSELELPFMAYAAMSWSPRPTHKRCRRPAPPFRAGVPRLRRCGSGAAHRSPWPYRCNGMSWRPMAWRSRAPRSGSRSMCAPRTRPRAGISSCVS